MRAVEIHFQDPRASKNLASRMDADPPNRLEPDFKKPGLIRQDAIVPVSVPEACLLNSR